MKSYIIFIFTFFLLMPDLCAQPVIRSIDNRHTPIQFLLVGHNDVSACSPLKSSQKIYIEPYSLFDQQLLLGSERPGLLLRPSAFYDQKHSKMYPFLNAKNEVDPKKLEKAFQAWKQAFNPKYKKSAKVWFAQWLCGDISFIHNHMEVFGYLLNVSIARVDNKHNMHACLVDYSEGLFSRQIIDITIKQKTKKGIVPHVKSFVGQGGLCQDGKIIPVQ